jgi:hypothetical protein
MAQYSVIKSNELDYLEEFLHLVQLFTDKLRGIEVFMT